MNLMPHIYQSISLGTGHLFYLQLDGCAGKTCLYNDIIKVYRVITISTTLRLCYM
jgi:hypothetical protein